jgi:ATP-dependent helicase YprA (DUF1998 family)
MDDAKCIKRSTHCALLLVSVPMPSQSKVKQYQDHEVDFSLLSDRAFEVFGKRPFRWQLEAAQAILCGWDVVLDIGTGSGKTLCFTLPLLLNNRDIAMTISPLTALMIDQASYFQDSKYTKDLPKYRQINPSCRR